MEKKTIVETVKKNVSEDKEVLAVMLFGSYLGGEYSDIDICIVLYPAKYDNLHLSRKRLEYLGLLKDFDVQIFQQLPVYVKIRIIKEGRIIFCRDERFLHEIALQTIRDFEDYEKAYEDYLEGVARG